MSDDNEPIGLPLPRTAMERRIWLLSEALRSGPLDQALELARRAELFITGPEPETESDASPEGISPDKAAEAAASPENRVVERPAEAASKLALSPEQRNKLLNRLVQGARNTELAAEFGILPKQVQGIRMGSAREIAKRRTAEAGPIPVSQREAGSADDVVRYLRQQDDTVVPDGNDVFVVNGRFRLKLEELVDRANKMRRRQGKPEFPLSSEKTLGGHRNSSSQHPMFWKEPSSGTRETTGSD